MTKETSTSPAGPVMLAAGVVGGAIGTVALAWLIAATKVDDLLTR